MRGQLCEALERETPFHKAVSVRVQTPKHHEDRDASVFVMTQA